MKQLKALTIPALMEQTFSKFSANKAFSFIGGKQKTYADLQKEINLIANLLNAINIQKGDKVAILAVNSPEWVASYMAIAAIGATVVPILPDFSQREITQIINHSGAKAVFVSEKLTKNLTELSLVYIIRIENKEIIKTPQDCNIDTANIEYSDNNFAYADICEDELLSIIYTSGTTGTSKGVMLTHKNIISNVIQCKKFQRIEADDRFLSILPLSHTFENTLGMLTPFASGSSVYYLDRLPTASILLPAMAEIKPTIMLAVPLVIEKIYQGKVLKEINSKKITKSLYKKRFFQNILNKIAGKKLYKAFGGKLVFFGIGGAKLDSNVEQFLLDSKFPYAIGYGMTETSPLIAGAIGKNRKIGSTGIAVDNLQMRLVKENDNDSIGEIQVKGPNVMQGYYKAPDITQEVFTEDGWLRTGDLGEFDEKGRLSIKGRIKTMILGSSGENIYPEEIESVINKIDLVQESLVTEKAGKLVAMVHLNMEELEKQAKRLQENLTSFKDEAIHQTEEAKKYIEEKAEQSLKDIRSLVNKELNKFSQIKQIILHPEPFEKTPTHKIKRFLYNLNNPKSKDSENNERIEDTKEDSQASKPVNTDTDKTEK